MAQSETKVDGVTKWSFLPSRTAADVRMGARTKVN